MLFRIFISHIGRLEFDFSLHQISTQVHSDVLVLNIHMLDLDSIVYSWFYHGSAMVVFEPMGNEPAG